MRQFRSRGSVEGVISNGHSYSDPETCPRILAPDGPAGATPIVDEYRDNHPAFTAIAQRRIGRKRVGISATKFGYDG